jgi:hypothetical protein
MPSAVRFVSLRGDGVLGRFSARDTPAVRGTACRQVFGGSDTAARERSTSNRRGTTPTQTRKQRALGRGPSRGHPQEGCQDQLPDRRAAGLAIEAALFANIRHCAPDSERDGSNVSCSIGIPWTESGDHCDERDSRKRL